jgi:hypothetical protein
MTRIERIIYHLTWMIETFDFQNEQTGIEQDDSPDLKDAKILLEELKNDTVE